MIYSKSIRSVVMIELTSPCEENMEQRHKEKTLKYSSLCTAATLNKWCVHFFAVEVGARGYCASSMQTSLRCLGVSKKSTRSALKELSSISLRCSFVIWMSRSSKFWENCGLSSASAKTHSITPRSSPSQSPGKPLSNVKKTLLHQGILNKGNTCYVSAILQALSSLPKVWSSLTSFGANLPPLSRSFFRTTSLLKSAKVPIDPSPFLSALENTITKSGNVNFKVNKQQDAPEILGVILGEICLESVTISDLLSFRLCHTITCDTCDGDSSHEEVGNILQLPLFSSIPLAINKFLEQELLSGENQFDCSYCSSLQPACLKHHFINVGNVLILQLKRFFQF